MGENAYKKLIIT